TWRTTFSSRSSSSPLATLEGGAARGYVAVPQVERPVAVHLCPQGAATWQDQPHLPSRAAYHAAGQAATAPHAMATLQVYQAQALKHLHEGGPDQGAMQELRATTALRATKVMARSLGQVMSTVVVQERHQWLTLAQMVDVDKARFLDAPISQGGLFGDTAEDFAQQFSAVQKQTEALKHIFPRRDSATTSAGPQPPPARRRGRPPAAPKTPAPPTGAARPLGTSQEHPQQSCEAGGGDCSLGDDNIYVPTPGGGPGATSISSPLGDALPPRIRTRRSISSAREPGKKTFLQDVLPSGISPLPLLAQTLCKIREDEEQVLLVAPYWPTWTCPSLEDPLEERPSFSGDGHNLAPASRPMEPARLAPGRDASDLSGLSQAVIDTITQQAYALRWGLFVDWCSSRGEDPQRCPIAVVLSFLQEKLERRL
ncbi:hypothetical protein M9458_041194, partial [Cirrhinus mrigala]